MKYVISKSIKVTFNILKYSIYLNLTGYRYIFLTINSFKFHFTIKIYKYKLFILKSFINYKLLNKNIRRI